MKFILTDDSVDRDYERVLITGLKTDNFEKNPIMLYQHRQDSFWTGKDAPLPIGFWKNISKTGNQISAEPEFNDTELAQQVKSLVEHGTLNACSIGFRAIAYSNDPALMLPGQKYATITQSELLECSIVMIPSNPNAVAVKSFDKDGKKYNITGNSNVSDEDIQKLDAAAKSFFQTPQNKNTMTELFEKLQKEVKGELSSIKSMVETFIKGAPAQVKTDGEKPDGEQKPEEATGEGAERMKEFTGKVEAIEKKLGEMQTENESLAKAKEDAEATVKSLTTEKETLATDKTNLEKEVGELKAANLKLSGGDEVGTTTVIEIKEKNDAVPEKPINETQEQKTKRLAALAASIKTVK